MKVKARGFMKVQAICPSCQTGFGKPKFRQIYICACGCEFRIDYSSEKRFDWVVIKKSGESTSNEG